METKQQYIYINGRFVKVAGSGGTNKQLLLSKRRVNVLPKSDDSNQDRFYKIMIRLTLLNFDESDVGSKICLYNYTYRTSGHKHEDLEGDYIRLSDRKRRYIHPADHYKQDPSHCIGIGVDYHNIKAKYPDFEIPSWIPNDGYMKTEWVITQQDISRGYLEFDGTYEFLPLIKPTGLSDDSYTYSFSGRGRFIKFALHDINNNMIVMSDKQIKIPVSDINIKECFDGVYRLQTNGDSSVNLFSIK